MKKYIFYFLLYTKRQLKHFSFLLILCLLPISFLLFSRLKNDSVSTIQVALYLDSQTNTIPAPQVIASPLLPDIHTVIQRLTEQEHTLGDYTLHFYICNSLSELQQDIKANHAECGYIIPSALYSAMQSGKKAHSIKVLVSDTTTLAPLLNEIVYADIFREYALYQLKSFLTTDSPLASKMEPSKLIDRATFLYDAHLADDSTFHFEYTTLQNNKASLSKHNSMPLLLSPLRGLLAIFIMLAGLCGAISFLNDKENHVYDNRSLTAIRHLQILSIFVPVFFMSFVGFISLYTSSLFTSLLPELSAMLFYMTVTTLIIALTTNLIKSKLLFTSLIPFQVIGSLIFTPIFIDLGTFLPAMKIVAFLFLPSYYLFFF